MKFSRSWMVLLALSLADNAHAEILYRCVSVSGEVSWQAAPCARGMRLVKSMSYTPDAPTALPLPGPPRITLTGRKSRASTSYRASTRTTRPKPDACARARVQREATLERVGLKRNFDLLSKLDADVRRVCR